MSDTPHQPKHAAHMAPAKPEAATQPAPARAQNPYDAPHHHSGGHGGHHTHHHGRLHSHRRTVVTVVVVALALVAALAVAGHAFYTSAQSVKAEAQEAIGQAGTQEQQILSGGSAGAQQTASAIAEAAGSMHAETSSPLWTAATAIPVVGGDVRSARTLVALVDDLAQNALVPLTGSLAQTDLNDIIGEDSSVNIDALNTLMGGLAEVAPVIQRDADAVNSLPEPRLEALKSPVQKAQDMLTRLSDGATTASEVGDVLPSLLGANGTRHYLVVAQCNSEIRSTGGFAGQFGTLTLDNGKLEMGDFQGLGKDTFQRYDVTPGLGDGYPISDAEYIIWPGAGLIPGDAGFIPDFSRVAEIWQWQWADQHDGQTFDGIIAVDPVFLQRLLGVVGGVTNEQTGYTLDGTTTAQILLNQVYIDYPDGQDSDAVFAAVAQQCFDQVLGNMGNADTAVLVEALADSVQNRNFQMWSANQDEEAALDRLGVTGRLNSDPKAPEVGFYVSNVSFGKIDWYLQMATTVGAGARNADGTTTYHVTTTLHNSMDPAVQDSLPLYIADPTRGEVPPRSAGDEELHVYMTAPAGGNISNLNVDGSYVFDIAETSYEDLQLIAKLVAIQPGETCTFTYDVTTAAGAGQLGVDMTPTGQGAQTVIE